MSQRFVFSILLLSLGAAPGLSQLVVGDVGVTGFSATQISVLHANGSSTVFPIPGTFLGTGTGWPQTILYDPHQPQSFLVGGSGFVGRVTITGAATASYSLITNAVSLVVQLSWDGTQLVAADAGTGQIVRIDPASGVVTPVTSAAQPWGADLSSAVIDPNSGDIYCGGNNQIFRIPSGSATPLLFTSGWAPSGSSSVSGLVIDPFSLQLVATLQTVARVVRIDPAGTLTTIAVPQISAPNALDVDGNGYFLVGTSGGAGNHNVYRVPNAGGAPQLIGVAVAALNNCNGVAAVIEPFRTLATPLGAGAASLGVLGVPPGTLEGFTVPSLDVSGPVGSGPIFGLSPDALSFAFVSAYPTASPGNIIHWTWPAPGLFPAVPITFPAGTFAPGFTIDLLVVGFNAALHITAAPVVRLVVN